MQGKSSWTPPGGTLGTIVGQAMERVESLRGRRAELERAMASAPRVPAFGPALRGPTVGVIAEVKRRSPSRGAINVALDAASQAAAYEAGGAAAVSVLTEPHHFGGSNADLEMVRARVGIPLLKKDFHVDESQLLEARVLGASAALLIARALRPDRLAQLVKAADAFGLESLVEVRTEDELHRALDAGARVVGVNCRNLETLDVDVGVAQELMPRIPADVVAVWESGIATPDDVVQAAGCGSDAVLVGSAVSAASDPEAAVRRLSGIPRAGTVRG
ncbi:MAG TPA: indole-3-glycerol phosphate synthase TrpC [Gemmatimonadaceae bacterium]